MRKYIFEDGVGRFEDMTAEEEAAYKAMASEQPAPEPTAEERIAALETDVVKHTTDITDMKEELDLILSGVTE